MWFKPPSAIPTSVVIYRTVRLATKTQWRNDLHPDHGLAIFDLSMSR